MKNAVIPLRKLAHAIYEIFKVVKVNIFSRMFWINSNKNRYIPVNYIKMEFKGVYISSTCFPNDLFTVIYLSV